MVKTLSYFKILSTLTFSFYLQIDAHDNHRITYTHAGREIKGCIDQPPDLNPYSQIQLNGQSISAYIPAKRGSTAPCMNPITSLDSPDHLEGLSNSS